MAPTLRLPESAVSRGHGAWEPQAAIGGRSPMDSFFDPYTCQTPDAFHEAPMASAFFNQAEAHAALTRPAGAAQTSQPFVQGPICGSAPAGAQLMFYPGFMGVSGMQVMDTMQAPMLMGVQGGVPMMQMQAPMQMPSAAPQPGNPTASAEKAGAAAAPQPARIELKLASAMSAAVPPAAEPRGSPRREASTRARLVGRVGVAEARCGGWGGAAT
eukprot:CAMPEP_0176248862 /NCGR_PEP_ID=MMETSP0121_2-20121125/33683_1 /TAXON_ID=160619 /ORGANISM="Kryptoperidinium foliaceum, Strain CCMP 1326" /LENGTH=213 /DNA_ID=CAMNT_0017588549 /DNA_START=57 /DNA_END=694 /DNA_ORIENTATION=-